MTSHDSVVVIYSTRRLVSTLQVAKYRLAAIYKVAKSRPCCISSFFLNKAGTQYAYRDTKEAYVKLIG